MNYLDGRIIKHRNAMDVCLLVRWHEGGVVTGEWINMGFGESFFINEQSQFLIQNLSDWLVCEEPTQKCLRYGNWKPLA